MTTPVILIDGLVPPPLGTKAHGTKADGATVALSLASTIGVDSCEWRVSKHNGSTAVLGSAFPASPFSTTFGAVVAGESYIVTAILNGDPTQIAQAEIAVPFANGQRVPRAGELSQWDPNDGIEADWRALAAVVPRKGVGSPNGAIVGSPGDVYLNTSGGAGTTLYVKESGAATNTGWVGK